MRRTGGGSATSTVAGIADMVVAVALGAGEAEVVEIVGFGETD
jgi:hypothetical protein